LAMWSSYEAYALSRADMTGSEYSGRYENYTFGELFAAPFQGEHLSRSSFWVPLAAMAAANIGLDLAADGGRSSVFATGRSYIGSREVPILVGFLSTAVLSAVTYDFVGIGEEAISRDLEYKELSIGLGVIPAKIINGITFPALHIPQEVRAGYGAGQILVDFAYRSAATLGLQWAYDRGGLPDAVALHMWIDTFTSLIDFLLLSGTPAVATVSFNVKL
ncbi:MAG TPA: CPBP family glutamic-type intramembrane protease, partial [Spirochaetia bacterium]|nr:CPBP family glutamic-type intramembrane protease [Spirochaetia bacterium]